MIEKSVSVQAGPEQVYGLVSDVRRMGRWSPECFAILVLGRGVRRGTRSVGFNRKRFWVWLTTCRVIIADPAREFAFRVTILGLPVATWGYRMTATDGGTELTEYWQDARTGLTGGVVKLLGVVFTGTGPQQRPAVNREGMRTTLVRIKAVAELA